MGIKMSNIFERASYMRQPGENWQNAIQRATYAHNMEQAGGAKKKGGRRKGENDPRRTPQERALARCNKKGRSGCAKKCVKPVCKSDPKCHWAEGPKRSFCRKAGNRKIRYAKKAKTPK